MLNEMIRSMYSIYIYAKGHPIHLAMHVFKCVNTLAEVIGTNMVTLIIK